MRAPFRLALVALLVILAGSVGASPALAHANVVGSKPAVDAQLAASPTDVSVTFDANLLDMGAAMVVRRDDGTVVSVGTPKTSGRHVSIPVDPAAGSGHYTVAFRVTTEDGHAVEASYGYTVKGTPSGSTTPSPMTTVAASAIASAPPETAAPAGSPATPPASEAHGNSGNVPVVPIALGGLAFVVLAVAGAVFQRRRA